MILLPLIIQLSLIVQVLSHHESHVNSYDGAKVFQMKNLQKLPILKYLADNGYQVHAVSADYLHVLVPSHYVHRVKHWLRKNSIEFSIVNENVGGHIRADDNPLETEKYRWRSVNSRPVDLDKYNTLESIYEYLDYLAERLPSAHVFEIGNSFENRTIKGLKILSGDPRADVVFIDGGIHAREWISTASVLFILHKLVEKRKRLSNAVGSVDFYIVPVLNPDGYVYTYTHDRMWRKSRSPENQCAGVDLNRNFNFHFGGVGTSGNECSEIYRGKAPHSELETQAFSKFLLALKGRLKGYITFHSYGQYILIPYGFARNSFPPNYKEMERVALKMAKAMKAQDGKVYKVGNTANALYPAAGGSDDWVKANTGAQFVYTIELRDEGQYGFLLPSKQIIPTGHEAFAAVWVLVEEIAAKK